MIRRLGVYIPVAIAGSLRRTLNPQLVVFTLDTFAVVRICVFFVPGGLISDSLDSIEPRCITNTHGEHNHIDSPSVLLSFYYFYYTQYIAIILYTVKLSFLRPTVFLCPSCYTCVLKTNDVVIIDQHTHTHTQGTRNLL